MTKKPLITLALIAILMFSLTITAFADNVLPMETLISAEKISETTPVIIPLPIDPIIIYSHFPYEH